MAVLTKEEYKLVQTIASSLERIAREMEKLNKNVFQVEVMNGEEEEDDEDLEEEEPIEVTGEVTE